MAQLRLTQKFAKDCGISNLSNPIDTAHPLDDWFIDVIRVSRKKVAMVTHAKSTYTFFIPYAKVGGAKAIPGFIGVLLKDLLNHHQVFKFDAEIDNLFAAAPPIFCKTIDKKILGHMNDFKRCSHYIFDSDVINFQHAEQMIAEMPVNFGSLKFIFPIELLGKLLGCSFKLRME